MEPFNIRGWLLRLCVALSLLLGLSFSPAFAQTPALRIGILGDSSVDEYRANDNRGGSFGSVTFNWVEQLVRSRNVTAGAWGTWGEPRRSGYEYNWARTAATAQGVILQGEHTGLANQVSQGKIDVAVISVGNQDFAPYVSNGYAAIYDGTLSDQEVATKVNLEILYITTAVDTVLAARRIPMIATTLTDFSLTLSVLTDPRFQDPAKRQRVSNAIAQVNTGIKSMAAARGMLVFDTNAYGTSLGGQSVNGTLNISGVGLNLFTFGDDPHNAVLGDHIHIGTITEGLFANQYLLLINQLTGANIPLFSDQEILATAGLSPQPNIAPVANNDTVTTGQNAAVNISYGILISNDTDANQDALNVTSTTQPLHGVLTSSASGLTYTPNPDYAGSDSFTYTISDGHGGSASATVNIIIVPPNRPPMAGNDTAVTDQDTAVNIPYAALLSNDSDLDNDALTVTAYTQAANGVVTTDANGFIYTPNTGYSGSDSFGYTISDGRGGTASAIVTVTVNYVPPPPPPNQAPIANNDTATTDQDVPVSISYASLLANDSDPDNDTLIVISYSPATNGVVTTDANGFIYTPNAGYSGSDSFGYTISDGRGGTASATVTVTVNYVPPPSNQVPVANNDTAMTNQDVPVSISYAALLSNDSDPDNDPLSVISYSPAANGVVTTDANGFIYAPNAGYSGSDSFGYTISDGRGGSANATVTLTVNYVPPVNHAPAAVPDTFTMAEDGLLNVNASSGVLANDTDSDRNNLTALLVTSTVKGSLILDADGSLIYVPNVNVNGSDSFSYKASDGMADSNVVTVTITINAVNDAPVAAADSYVTNEDTALSVPAKGVLTNDTDVEGSALTAILVTAPTKGVLSLSSNGSFTYTPNANINGSDSFSYKANDGAADSNVVTVTITINAVNDAPVAAADAYSVNSGATLTVAASGVLANDNDVDGDSLTAALVTSPTKGTLTLNSNGGFSYIPNPTASGSDSFTYRANDGSANSNTVTVTITIVAVNRAPVAVADSYTTNEDTTLNVAAKGVLTNDTDADGNTLTATLVTSPTKGTLTLNSNGGFTYTPNANVNGSDSFTYRASDGITTSNTVTVTITITAVNDAPVAKADTFSVRINKTLTISYNSLLSNDTDVDGDTRSVISYTAPTSGTLTLSGSNLTFKPRSNWIGTVTFTYTISDGHGGTSTATVTIRVTLF